MPIGPDGLPQPILVSDEYLSIIDASIKAELVTLQALSAELQTVKTKLTTIIRLLRNEDVSPEEIEE